MLSIQEYDVPEVSVPGNKHPLLLTRNLKQCFVLGTGETDFGYANDVVSQTLQMPGRGCVHVLVKQESHSGRCRG